MPPGPTRRAYLILMDQKDHSDGQCKDKLRDVISFTASWKVHHRIEDASGCLLCVKPDGMIDDALRMCNMGNDGG